jgi:methyltransferase FkbM-like protein
MEGAFEAVDAENHELRREVKTLHARVSSGDRVCKREAFEPDVVKIDVEGHELRVLQRLRETLRANRPLLFLEIHPAMIDANPANGSLAELVGELTALGYELAERGGSVIAANDIIGFTEIERLLLRPT